MDYQRRMRDITSRMQVAPDEDQLKVLGGRVLQQMIDEKVTLHEARRPRHRGLGRRARSLHPPVRRVQGRGRQVQREALREAAQAHGHDQGTVRGEGPRSDDAREAPPHGGHRRAGARAGSEAAVPGKRDATRAADRPDPRRARARQGPVDEPAIDAYLGASEAEVKTQYDADFNRLYNIPKKATFRTIVLRSDLPSAEGSEETGLTPALRQRADAIAKDAATKDFADLARRYSEDLSAAAGGLLDKTSEPEMDPALAKVVFATQPGTVSPVVETGRGLEIVKVESLEDARSIPFDEVKREIARDMIARKEVSRVAGELAEKILAEWKTTGTPPKALLDENHLMVTSTGR
jgi:hypothetical protein